MKIPVRQDIVEGKFWTDVVRIVQQRLVGSRWLLRQQLPCSGSDGNRPQVLLADNPLERDVVPLLEILRHLIGQGSALGYLVLV